MEGATKLFIAIYLVLLVWMLLFEIYAGAITVFAIVEISAAITLLTNWSVDNKTPLETKKGAFYEEPKNWLHASLIAWVAIFIELIKEQANKYL